MFMVSTAWSGAERFAVSIGRVVVVPVVAGALGLFGFAVVPGAAGVAGAFGLAVVAVAVARGSLTNLIWSKGSATFRSPIPRKPPTPTTTAWILPLLSTISSLMSPIFSSFWL